MLLLCRNLYTRRYLPRMINLPSRFKPLSYRRSYFNILKFYPKCAVYQNFYHKLPTRLFPRPPVPLSLVRPSSSSILFALSATHTFRTCPFDLHSGKLTASGVGDVHPAASGQNIIRVMRKRRPRSVPSLLRPTAAFQLIREDSPPTVLCPRSNARFHREALLDGLFYRRLPTHKAATLEWGQFSMVLWHFRWILFD